MPSIPSVNIDSSPQASGSIGWGEESMFTDGIEGITPTLISDTGDRYWDVLAWRLAADR